MDYRQLAYQTAQKYGIDPDLFVRQIQAESAFRPDAVSSAGAIGLGQLMPATAKELGVDPNDPVQNLEGAARYMKQQLDRFGDPALALAAYNAGPSRVAKAGGVPNITETQNYVAKILGGKGGAAMAQQPQGQQPQGLLGGLLGGQGIGGALGLSDDLRDRLAMGIMAGSDPRQFAPLIEQRAAGMRERKEEAKEQRQRNKSLEYLKQRADAGDAMAGQIYGAVSTGVLPVGAGVSEYLTQSLKGNGITDTADYKNYSEYVKGMENPISFKEYMDAKNRKPLQNKGTYRYDNRIIGEVTFDPNSGEYFETVNGQRVPIDISKAQPVTDATFAKAIPNYGDFVKLSEGLSEDRTSMDRLQSYMKSIGNTNEGFQRLGDQMTASLKTLLSGIAGPEWTTLSKEELNAAVAQGQLQGLIGRFRIETVGGGVMTEQDALRIIANLGGDVNALQNKEIVAQQIETLFRGKLKSFENKRKRHDAAIDALYGVMGFDKVDEYEFDKSVFNLTGSVSDTKTTMTDEQLLAGIQGKTPAELSKYLESLSEADFNRLMQLQ
jgi:hypothetical protein